MKAMTLAIGLLCAIPLAGLADQTATRGAKSDAKVKKDPARAADGDHLQTPVRGRFKDFNPTPAQVTEAEAFFEVQSPAHYRAYKKAMERGGSHRWLQKWIVRNHVELKAVETADPQLYAMKLDQIRIEDKIFGIVADANEPGPVDREKVREELRPIVNELVATRKQESAHRIERLQTALKNEQSRLDAINESSDSWVDARISEELSRGGRLAVPQDARRTGTLPTTSGS
jgi:hypothetical protein